MEIESGSLHVSEFFEGFCVGSKSQFGLAQHNLLTQRMTKIQCFIGKNLGSFNWLNPVFADFFIHGAISN